MEPHPAEPRGAGMWARWGRDNPELRACDSCRGLEETRECNCVSAEPRPLPQDASSGIASGSRWELEE